MDRRNFCAAMFATAFGTRPLFAEPDAAANLENAEKQVADLMNFMSKTAGGKQLWADVWFFHDWRIQCCSLTGHFRLLDGANRRHASGTYEVCRDKMDEIRSRGNLPPMEGKAIIVLHGLFRTRTSMSTLGTVLSQSGSYKAFCMGYPTTRGSVEAHARSLDNVIRSLEGISEINFIAHSLGNLVVRHWLHDFAAAERTLPKGQSFGRMVMLAPPNRQPKLATLLVRGPLANIVAGPAAESLATKWETLEPKLATPHFDFGVLAGGKGDGKGYNPLLPGDDDGVVTVESTRLPGAKDFRLLPVVHSFFMNDKRVHEYALRFFANGHFETAENRQPNRIVAEFARIQTNTERLNSCESSYIRMTSTNIRIAGIDYGTVRIGIALADTEVGIAGPFDNYSRRSMVLDGDYFKTLAKEERIERFVVGLPVHLHGGESQKSTEARTFGKWLTDLTGVPVDYFDERFTTSEADQLLSSRKLTKKQRQSRRDQLAAQIMLTAYIEAGGKSEPSPESID